MCSWWEAGGDKGIGRRPFWLFLFRWFWLLSYVCFTQSKEKNLKDLKNQTEIDYKKMNLSIYQKYNHTEELIQATLELSSLTMDFNTKTIF